MLLLVTQCMVWILFSPLLILSELFMMPGLLLLYLIFFILAGNEDMHFRPDPNKAMKLTAFLRASISDVSTFFSVAIDTTLLNF